MRGKGDSKLSSHKIKIYSENYDKITSDKCAKGK